MEQKFKKVLRNEYLIFIKNYKNKLEFNCTGIYEPPLETYNDFNDNAMWPKSVVAYCKRDWMGDDGEIDNSIPGKFWEYYIKDK